MGGDLRSISCVICFIYVLVVIWNTLENGEDSDENVYGIPMMLIVSMMVTLSQSFLPLSPKFHYVQLASVHRLGLAADEFLYFLLHMFTVLTSICLVFFLG